MNELTTLSTLAVEINLLNEQVEHHKNQAVIYAARTGEKLLLAKAQCKHGEFGNWLKENCTVSQRYANQFMKLAVDMPELLTSNWNTSSNLGLKQALELLSATEEVKTEVTAKIEAGEDVTIKEIQRLKKEAADAQAKAQSLQNDLIYTADRAEELRKKVEFQKLTVEAIEKQNDQLRNDLATKVELKVEERIVGEKAKSAKGVIAFTFETRKGINSSILRPAENAF